MSALLALAAGAHHATISHIVANSPLPPSYGGDRLLAALNLLLMMAGTYVSAAMWGSELRDLWRYRHVDRWNHPVTAQRLTMMLAGMAAFVRCGAEAATILGWDPRDPETGVVVLSLKHYLDPVATFCLFGWLTMRMVSKRAINAQLRREPLPIRLWATWPQLVQPGIIVALVAIMSFGAIYLRGR